MQYCMNQVYMCLFEVVSQKPQNTFSFFFLVYKNKIVIFESFSSEKLRFNRFFNLKSKLYEVQNIMYFLFVLCCFT